MAAPAVEEVDMDKAAVLLVLLLPLLPTVNAKARVLLVVILPRARMAVALLKLLLYEYPLLDRCR